MVVTHSSLLSVRYGAESTQQGGVPIYWGIVQIQRVNNTPCIEELVVKIAKTKRESMGSI